MDFFTIQTKIKQREYSRGTSYYREDVLQAIQDSTGMSVAQSEWIYLNSPKCENGYDMSEDCLKIQLYSYRLVEFLHLEK